MHEIEIVIPLEPAQDRKIQVPVFGTEISCSTEIDRQKIMKQFKKFKNKNKTLVIYIAILVQSRSINWFDIFFYFLNSFKLISNKKKKKRKKENY